jgi:selenide,water dikinase
MLPGVEGLISKGVVSSLQKANALVLRDYQLRGFDLTDPRVQLLVDPQTSGGMLATLPKDRIGDCLKQLIGKGYQASVIGEICDAGIMEIV